MEKNSATDASRRDGDEINLLEYFYVLVRHKRLILGLTVLGLLCGLVAAYVKGPTHVCEVIIAAKDSEGRSAPSFAGLGALGGLVASQLDLAGNPSLDKIDVILESRLFNAEMIEKGDLLPFIFKHHSPKVYAAMYDETKGSWSPEFKPPRMLDMGGLLKGKYMEREIFTKSKTMSIRVESSDSTFSDTLLAHYVGYLNLFIQNSVRTEARENVAFLENQLIVISDPLLREKIQALIANEVEKEMMVSKSAFKVTDPPYSYIRFRERQLFPFLGGAGVFFTIVSVLIAIHAIGSGVRTDQDRALLARIRQELRRIP